MEILKKREKIIFVILTVLYILLMFWLLYGQRIGKPDSGGLVLVPFQTIVGDIRTILFTDSGSRGVLLMNLVGNVVVFIPIGIILPAFFRIMRKFPVFLAAAFLIDLAIETVQYVTKLGWFDIDDILLNIPGMAIGYLVFRIIFKKLSEKRGA